MNALQQISPYYSWIEKMSLFMQILGDGSGYYNDSMIDQWITNPIAQNMATYTGFVFTIIAILALIGGFKIFQKWQLGEEPVAPMIFRWGGALIAVLIIAGALRTLAENQTQLNKINPDTIIQH